MFRSKSLRRTCTPAVRACGAVALLLCGALSAPAWAGITSETENNDTESRANGPITTGTAVSASMASRSDVDWYYMDVAAGAINISLNHSTGRDFDWALYGTSGSRPILTR